MGARLVRVLCSSMVASILAAGPASAWIQRVSPGSGTGRLVGVDAAANVVVAGGDTGGLRVARFDGATGTPLWSVNPGGTGGGTLEDLAIASDGDPVLVGRVPPDADHGWALRLDAASGAQV